MRRPSSRSLLVRALMGVLFAADPAFATSAVLIKPTASRQPAGRETVARLQPRWRSPCVQV